MGNTHTTCGTDYCGNQVKKGASPFCKAHKCVLCDRQREGMALETCADHACKMKSCRAPLLTGVFCNKHSPCAFKSCSKFVGEEGDFCSETHGCQNSMCARERTVGNVVCRLHVCGKVGCTKSVATFGIAGRGPSSSWCREHGCRLCDGDRNCAAHRYQFPGCTLTFPSGTPGCKHHACAHSRCKEPIQTEQKNRYCLTHDPAVPTLHVSAETGASPPALPKASASLPGSIDSALPPAESKWPRHDFLARPGHKEMGCKASRERGVSDPKSLAVRKSPVHITLAPCPRDACGNTRYVLNIPGDFEFCRARSSGSDRWEKRLSAMCTSCRTFRIVFVVWRSCAECRLGPAILSALCGGEPIGKLACLSCGTYHTVDDPCHPPLDDRLSRRTLG